MRSQRMILKFFLVVYWLTWGKVIVLRYLTFCQLELKLIISTTTSTPEVTEKSKWFKILPPQRYTGVKRLKPHGFAVVGETLQNMVGYIRGKKTKQHGLATVDQNLQDLSPWVYLRPQVYQMSKQALTSWAFGSKFDQNYGIWCRWTCWRRCWSGISGVKRKNNMIDHLEQNLQDLSPWVQLRLRVNTRCQRRKYLVLLDQNLRVKNYLEGPPS